ncbi:uncharacterized protein LOC110819091 [Carica papaya]|uniref:uncharacterized protein LOC110819091 n=1 Tax=Carica papaya TaxID=3649 RepID=UPI000B8CD85E|nr:uncharacterized protein LOC110819091 [Carica papaya]
MAASLLRTQSIYHARSNSLPSRPHSLSLEVGEYLSRLRSSEATSISSSSISRQISGLQDLNDCVDKLLQLPLTQQAFSQEHHKVLVDQVLDESLRLLDLCSSAKDALWQTKETIHEFQSATLRKRSGEIGIVDEAQAKLTSNWSLISKLMSNGRITCEEEDENEFGLVDSALGSFIGCKSGDVIKTENPQGKLQNLELCVEDLEGVECLFRCFSQSQSFNPQHLQQRELNICN